MAAIGDGGAGPSPSTPLSASLSPDEINVGAAGYGRFTTPTFICSGSGGVAPYTYTWSIDGDFELTDVSDNEARATTGSITEVRSGTISCEVEDSDTNTVTVSADITVVFSGSREASIS